MPKSRARLSPEYPVIYDVAFADPAGDGGTGAPWEGEGTAFLSLALLVDGIPSFLATIPVDRELLDGILASLDAGDVQVSVAGFAADAGELESGAMEDPDEGDLATGMEGQGGPPAPWKASAGTPDPDAFRTRTPLDDPPADRASDKAAGSPDARLSGAHLSLLCRDGRRLGVARIVSRDRRATPDDVARYVLRQISSGVQIGDLASAG
jgi:hypothetical protein